ncbi:MAG: hypothetical protein C0392_04680 [Syntrophus sp. (in: bacteria)]|nr:hypothetical protein [Syntrophus sp. (in: bacteria)]
MGIILFAVKVLLVQPPIEDFYDTSIRTYPLALLYLGAQIKDICEVTVLDLRTGRKPRRLDEHPFPDLNIFYKEHIRTPFSFFSAYYRFGADEGEIKREIEKEKPDVVCISSLFTTYSLEALDVARSAKETNKEIITVVGGIHPTLFPRHVLASPWVDYVIRGEGETPLFQMVSALITGGIDKAKAASIDGLCSKEGDKFIISEAHVEKHIDIIPERRLVDPEAYRIGKRNYSFFLTSRGCPFHCTFCGRPAVPYRRRGLESIEKEIGDCLDLNIKAIDFEDDMLNLNARLFKETMKLFEGKDLTLSAMNGIYSETLDAHTLETMYSAGFRRLNFSLVDISKPLIQRQERLFSRNFLTLIPYLEDSPYLVEAHFIIGLPGQKPEEIIDTLLFLMGKRILPGPSLFYLAPNSPIFNEVVGDDWEGAIKSMRSSAMVPVNPLLPRETLFTFMKLVRFINYVKQIIDREPGLKTLCEVPMAPALENRPIDREILSALISERRFKYYDVKEKRFLKEPLDEGLERLFFRKAEGMTIRGFKTMNSLKVHGL